MSTDFDRLSYEQRILAAHIATASNTERRLEPIWRPKMSWLVLLLTAMAWLLIFAVSYGIYLLSGIFEL